MGQDIFIKILRYNPNNSQIGHNETFRIEANNNSTILEGLLQVYEKYDSTLAFSYGCRVKNCGLCAVNVDGKPHYACVTRIRDGMQISPLENLPVIKDLVFERRIFSKYLENFKPYVVREREPEALPEIINQPDEHTQLMSCRECFACMSSCPKYDYRQDHFGGPLAFVKLAQLHYDVRDSIDRVKQVKEMGILNCSGCSRCTCISGIPINKIVIKPFLDLLTAM
ncbi:conserved hypothetical protein [uncultured Desulfobacterium sp.]|uniref:succinate dehydrogenase n=1 Tax=uncultured Desulfobacterium sp. TaxID=201089 RepID=A0A445MXU6_9BACT|nr:conserved hypothetical protein [uncultured Desulfobacterium sp.]